MVGDLARQLREEASEVNERRLLVLAGAPSKTRRAAREALSGADVPAPERTVVGPEIPEGGEHIPGERVPIQRTSELLGRTRTAVVLDCQNTLRPNALGRTVGAVDGGGLYVLLVPPLDEWPDRTDVMDEWLAVPPFDVGDVAGRFRSRTVSLLRAHPGIAVVDVDEGRVEREGLTAPTTTCTSPPPLEPPAEHTFPAAAYRACLTEDQVRAVAGFETLHSPGRALVVEADRGRGKSSAAGLAAASLALAGEDVLVTAPQYRSGAEVFRRAAELLTELDALSERDSESNPHRLGTATGRIRFANPAEAVQLPGEPDVVLVDEAAALPVRRLSAFLAASAVAFTTTIHGYEGAGRGFSVRFNDALAESAHAVDHLEMTEPIRYAAGDPIESWAFRTLVLDARPAVDPLVAEASTESVDYEELSPDRLMADEHLLRETFGLLVLAHYRTEPDDLARLLDAPNVCVRALLFDGHVVSVALLAREGGLPAETRREMYRGGRIRGNMIPDVLTTQLRDEEAGVPVGQRVLRIATHPAVRSRGLGSKLLAEIEAEWSPDVDWLGTGYGATPELVDFWSANGYRSVHLSTTRNDASGEHSAIMLSPCTECGHELTESHTDWFLSRLEPTLTDAYHGVDPDVVRSVLRSIDATPSLPLSEREWRLVAGVPGGAATIDADPGPFRRLALRHLIDPNDPELLEARTERLLVRTVLQAAGWETVADELGFVSDGECKRAAGRAIRSLVETYGTTFAREELDRY